MVGTCWTDLNCRRALIVSHGGAWTPIYPYDSFPAFERAFDQGSDAVKGDYRVSKDGFGLVVHSSPFEWYESVNCWGYRCEDMTAKEVTDTCDMEVTTYKFINASKLMNWAKDRVIVMFDVKRSQDIPNAIQTIINLNAQNRTFLEIGISDLLNTVPKTPNWRQVFYLANARSVQDYHTMLDPKNAWLKPNVFTFEFDPKLVPQLNMTLAISNLHKAGFRTLTATRTQILPSVKEQEDMFRCGIDVVYTYDTYNGVIARTKIDEERGINPPNQKN